MTEQGFDPSKFIDREFEQELFESLLLLRGDARILAIRAGGGMGKSSLLEKFQYRCRVVRPRIPVSLIALDQLTDASPLALIREVVRGLGALGVEFTAFQRNEDAWLAGDFQRIRAFIELEGSSFNGASDVLITGIYVETTEHLTITNGAVALTSAQELVAQRACIAAFFGDLRRYCIEQTAVVMLDAYEKCPVSLRRWIIEHLLERGCFDLSHRPERLIVVIAGRELPAFEHFWPREDCQNTVQSVKELGRWERRHVEECLRVHGYEYKPDDIDLFHQLVERGIPPSQVVQLIHTMLANQQRYP